MDAVYFEKFDGDPTPFPATQYLDYYLLQDGYTATFQSPEPATLSLLVLGGLAMLRRRK